MSIFTTIDKNAAADAGKQVHSHNTTANVMAGLRKELASTGSDAFVGEAASQLSFGMESFSGDKDVTMDSLSTSLRGLTSAIEGIAVDHKLKFTAAQLQAARYAGALTGDIRGYLLGGNRDAGADAIPASGGMGRMTAAIEAYDEKENRKAALYTVAYNLQASRQDEFGEAFFPPVIVPPDENGYHVHITLVNLIDSIRRKTTGEADNYNRKNIVHVLRNPDLIRSDSTVMTPVVRSNNLANFVDSALIATSDIEVDRQIITTAPLAIGKTLNMLGLCQTDLQLDTAALDETDSIDTDIALKNIYVKVGADVLAFNVRHLRGAQYNYAVQGDGQRMDLRMEINALVIGKATRLVGGGALVDLDPVVAGDYQVTIGMTLTGEVYRDLGKTSMSAMEVAVLKVIDAAGVTHAPSSASVAAIVALFNNAVVIGYDLDMRRTNLNRRSIGQMLETREYTQVYAVPLLAPMTIKRPQGVGDSTDASDLGHLVTQVRALASGSAVNKLLAVRDLLAQYKNDRSAVGDSPKVLGVASELVTPFFDSVTIAIDQVAMTRNSAELAANIRATITNVLRERLARAYQQSGYRAASEVLAGGPSDMPRVIIGTDQIIAQWLHVDGELRTLGDAFGKPEIVVTMNDKMKGRLYATFMPANAPEGVPHPLHFGNMAYKPEVAVVLPIHRNGANNKELTVQPSFIHVANLPILIEVIVEGIPETVDARVPVSVNVLP